MVQQPTSTEQPAKTTDAPKPEEPKPAEAQKEPQLPAEPVTEKVPAEPAAQPTEKTDKPPTEGDKHEQQEKVTSPGGTSMLVQKSVKTSGILIF